MRADFSLDYDVLTVERPQKLYLMARFTAGPSLGEQIRRPLNLSLVIDRSGSMAGDKIDYTRQAAQFLVQHLDSSDTFSIVLYNDKIETLLPPEQVANKDAISQRIEQIRVRGTTNLSGGWLQGCVHVSQNLADKSLNRVILMSDGLANRGVTDMDQLLLMARQKRQEGVSTTTMGLGTDFNEDLLMEMANAGGGAFYFIETPESTPLVFQEELSGLLNVVGQNLTITITPSRHVSFINQLNAYPMHTNGQQTTFRLGDIFGDEVKTLLVEISIPALNTIGEEEIAHLRFDYDEIVEGETHHQVIEIPVLVNIANDGSAMPIMNPDVAEQVLLLKAAQARRRAVEEADKGNYDTASQVLKDVADSIEQSSVQNEQLDEERAALRQQADKMSTGPGSYDEYSRKTMSTQAFYTMHDRHDHTVMLRERENQKYDLPAIGDKDYVIPQPGVTPTHVVWNGQSFRLKGDLIRVGRAEHNEIVIDQKGVSRFHAQIRRENGRLLIEDLGSTNGTSVGDKTIDSPYPLSVGDVVYLSDEQLIFRLGTSDE